MKYLKNTTYKEIFESWREQEGNNLEWLKIAHKKGWPDWESWRRYSASQIQADKREWKIYQFENPLEEISAMLIGPYTGWQKDLPEKNKLSFAETMQIPKRLKWAQNHSKVQSILKNFPADTQFIGIIRADNEKIVCLEGHHRAIAVAFAKQTSQPIIFSGKITIAIAEFALGEEILLDKALEKGSTKSE